MTEPWLDEGRSAFGRLNYFLGKLSLGVAMVVAVTLLEPDSSVLWIVGLVLSFVSFALEVMRLRSIGVSQWLVVLRFVPYVNLLYMIFLQSAQPGWIETRKLDSTGRTLLIFQIGLLVVMILMLMRMKVALPYLVY